MDTSLAAHSPAPHIPALDLTHDALGLAEATWQDNPRECMG